MNAARWCGVAVAAVGVAGLIGWWADVSFLRSVIPGLAQMKPNTAAGLALCGFGLAGGLGAEGRVQHARVALGLLALLVGAATLGEHAFQTGGAFDALLVGGGAAVGQGEVLRMTPAAATGLVLSGGGIVLTGWPTSRAGGGARRRGVAETALSLLVTLIGLLAVLGYLFGARSLYNTLAYSSMAVHTALMFTLVGIGLSLSRPQQGLAKLVGSAGAGGVVARRAMGFFIVVAPLLGWVRLKGQEMGWYDTSFGLALMLGMMMIVGIALVWWTASVLERADSWRAALQEDLAASVTREHSTAAQRGAILNALPSAIALLGDDGRVMTVNGRWRSIAADPESRRASESVGQPFIPWAGELLAADADGWQGVAKGLRAVIDGEAREYIDEVRTVPPPSPPSPASKPNGVDRSRWLEVRIAPVPSATASRTGRPDQQVSSLAGGGAVVKISDITEQRRLEEQLVHSQRLEAVGRLAGGVAHDFNNLLTAVSGHCAIAQERLRRGEGVAPNLEAIEQAARSGAELTQQLLAFGRRQVIAPKVVSIGEIIGSVRRLIERSLGESIRLRIAIDDRLWPARVDSGRVEQVLMNMVINARDAIPARPEGGMVLVEAANAVLDEAYCNGRPGVVPGRYVCVSVSDTGAGMSPEVIARIFEPFFTTKERGRGTGLGLATSFGIVKQHGGHIAVYSELGAGSTFRVYLPAAAGEVVEAAPQPGAKAPRGSERILLIDDHEAARGAVAAMLRSLGYKVAEAADGAEARRLIGSSKPAGVDLVVCDVMLPDGNGPEIVDQLRAAPGWPSPSPPVVFISGYTANAVMHHGVLEPKVQFIAKPFTIDELGGKIRSSLDRAGEKPAVNTPGHGV